MTDSGIERGGVRASDAERDAIVRRLGDATAEGRLTLGELESRAGAAMEARTRRELDVLVGDLPEGTSTAPVVTAEGARTKVSVNVLGGLRRRGPWTVPPRLLHVSVLGGSRFDLADAELSGREVTITVVSVLGGVRLRVPEAVRLEVGGVSLLGGRHVAPRRSPPPGAPVVRLRIFSVLGGTRVVAAGPAGARTTRAASLNP